jgi:pilus assembly protein Flp/PilA
LAVALETSTLQVGPFASRAAAFISGGSSMALINALLASFRTDDEGQGLAEYALILALIAIVAIVALIFLGNQVSTILHTVGNSI